MHKRVAQQKLISVAVYHAHRMARAPNNIWLVNLCLLVNLSCEQVHLIEQRITMNVMARQHSLFKVRICLANSFLWQAHAKLLRLRLLGLMPMLLRLLPR